MHAHHASIDLARIRNERFLLRVIAGLGGVGSLTFLGQLPSPSFNAGTIPGALITFAMFAGYAWLDRLNTRTVTAGWVRWLATTVEISVPLMFMVPTALVDPLLALHDAPAALWVMAIFVSVLRLTPALTAYAGALACAEWFGVWAWCASQVGDLDPSINLAGALRRTFIFAASGTIATYFSYALIRMIRDIETNAEQRERLRRLLGAYVPTPVVQRLMREESTRISERRTATVLFVDIRDFTQFAEDHPVDEVVSRLNLALERFALRVEEHGGLVNKFLGDGMMALFGAPFDDPDHAQHALDAALAILESADALDSGGAWNGLRVGVGLHTGELVLGDIGGDRQREYTAIGSTVNTASRVESANKALSTRLLLTESVRAELREGRALRDLGPVALRGLSEPVRLYTVA